MRLGENFASSAASRASFSCWLATLTATTSDRGTRGFLGWTRSAQTQAKPFCLPLLWTEKANLSSASLVPGRDKATRRTSDWSATGTRSRHGSWASMTLVTSGASGCVPGLNLLTTEPSGATTNFSKFHWMSPASPSASGTAVSSV